VAEIPYTEVDMIRAVNEGVPVVTSRPGSPVALAMTKMAQAIVGIQTETGGSGRSQQRRRGLFARRSSG